MDVPRFPPAVSQDTAYFWNGLREHQLLLQQCSDCGALRHPPSHLCGRCRSSLWQTTPATGQGQIYSYVIPRRPATRDANGDAVVVVLVELSEGVRIVGNLAADEDPPEIGAEVVVGFADYDGYALPEFRRVRDRAS